MPTPTAAISGRCMMPNSTCPSATMPIATRTMFAGSSSAFHIPAAAGRRNAASATESQKRNTRMPALRIASPAVRVLPARLPMIALPAIPAATRAIQSGALTQALSSRKSGERRVERVLREVAERDDVAPQQQDRRRAGDVHRAARLLHRRLDRAPALLGAESCLVARSLHREPPPAAYAGTQTSLQCKVCYTARFGESMRRRGMGTGLPRATRSSRRPRAARPGGRRG